MTTTATTTQHDLPFVRGVHMGIDPSLNRTGVAVIGQYDITLLTIEPKGLTGVPRLLYLRNEVLALVCAHQPDSVTLEGYAYGRANQAHQVGEWGGVLRMALWDSNVTLREVSPDGLKKFVVGKGGVPKTAVPLNLFKRWGLDVPDPDEADAAGLALVGAYLRDPALCGVTEAQKQALQKVNTLRHGVRARARPYNR